MFRGIIVLLLLATTPLQAAIHRWVDDNGVVHYSDREPTSHKAPTREIKLSPSSEVKQESAVAAPSDLTEENEENRPPREGEYFKDEAKKACEDSKLLLKNAQSEQQLYLRDDDGSRRYIDDKERQEYLDKLNANIIEYCQ